MRRIFAPTLMNEGAIPDWPPHGAFNATRGGKRDGSGEWRRPAGGGESGAGARALHPFRRLHRPAAVAPDDEIACDFGPFGSIARSIGKKTPEIT